jgi:catechol 2,3-dioxygenase-like lactoylglutathione lyase family enzyme
MKLDHLTILFREPEPSAAFYGLLLPRLGLAQQRQNLWANADGLHLQFGAAESDGRDGDRYGPGLNHFGFAAPSPQMVEDLANDLAAAGHEPRLQRFDNGALALFIPDPDGLRIEVSWYPPPRPQVD